MPRRDPTQLAQLKVRMREPLRARLEKAAEEHRVSINAEAVERLEQSFGTEDQFGGPDVANLVRHMALAFFTAGEAAARRQGHPEWKPADWMQDGVSYHAAMAAVVSALASASDSILIYEIRDYFEQMFRRSATAVDIGKRDLADKNLDPERWSERMRAALRCDLKESDNG